MTIVWGAGRKPCDVLLCGEAPGSEEARIGEPFVGPSGAEQEAYLSRHHLTARSFYRTNVVKTFIQGNPDPTPALIDEWTPTLEQEIEEVRPRLVVAVGLFATRWFLGDDVTMEMTHGLPHRAGAFDPLRADRARGAVVLPIYHPAFGMYDNEARPLLMWDYEQVAKTLAAIKRGETIRFREDTHAGREEYRDVSGAEMAEWANQDHDAYGLDTEGSDTDVRVAVPWSIQVSGRAGEGLILRCDRPDFAEGIRALQRLTDRGSTVVLHHAMYDVEMSRKMGLELRDARWWDTMYAAYLTRLEPKGLKALAYRLCGMRMDDFSDVVGDAGTERQIGYLIKILESAPWPKPEGRVEIGNDGQAKLKTPQPVERRAEAILADYAGKGADPYKRWRQVDSGLRLMVERRLGVMEPSMLPDVPLHEAVHYSCRDADAALRLYPIMQAMLKERGLDQLMRDGMEIAPIFEEIQSNGMPARRSHFARLSDELTLKMSALQQRISHRYWGDEPFNPASPDQVTALMERRGLKGLKKSKKTGKMSTAKKSIEHLGDEDPAIRDIMEWRGYQKNRDSFCEPTLERFSPDEEEIVIKGEVKTTTVHTRRLSMADPNLLAVPVRSEEGRKIRDGYVCGEGEVFGAWDLSQIEMRYMAHVSKDPLLCAFFNDPTKDVHAETAARIFRLPINEQATTKKERYAAIDEMLHRLPAKRAGFGIITNITGLGLVDLLRSEKCVGWTEESCDDLIVNWLNVYQGVKEYMDRCKREVRRDGMVRDEWGMIRYLPGVWSPDKRARAEHERAASSHKISGGAQGMIQNSMRYLKGTIRQLQRDGLNVMWRNQIHDELILSFDEELWDVMDALVTDALENHHGVKMTVPVRADSHKGKTWGGLKG